ncbi:MAG: uroporphyrinogen-III synthase, partial [Actinomycetota bacterium]|nr:uroporphyrinogen-III synthase [Actinomycetota bacterium]
MSRALELCGFTVGVTADRRSDEQTLMLTRLGVDVIRGPSIRTLPVGDDVRLRSLTEALIADPPDYLVANTGLGMRSWLGLAATWGLDEALRDAFAETRIAARGPKAAAAVAIAGLGVWWRADSEQLASVGA